MISGIVMSVPLGMTCGFETSPAIVDIDSYPEYIHMPTEIPPAMKKSQSEAPVASYAVSWNEIVSAVSALPPQFMKPHTATSPNATITSIESIVLAIPTSFTPRILIHVNMIIIAALMANSPVQPRSH